MEVIKEKRTEPKLTKYERARVLGIRAKQLSLNAPPNVELNGETDPLEIARMELEQKRLVMKIRRDLPDGTSEVWKVSELE